jgi:tRNA A-37 threonylcarbamoyl transferase component Bud32
MIKCLKAGISVPAIYFVDLPNNRIVLEYVNGITLKDFLTSHSQTGSNISNSNSNSNSKRE